MTREEQGQQIALLHWADMMMNQYPELDLMYHIPNEGKRSVSTGSRLKKLGLKAGVPDIVLPVARGGYHGLYIEMKYGRNTLTDNQRQWMDALKKAGHLTAVCYSFMEAKDVILGYLGMKP